MAGKFGLSKAYHTYVPEKWKGKTFDKIDDKRLKLKWIWAQVCRLSMCAPAHTEEGQQRLPCQGSEAFLENDWVLEVDEWTNQESENGHRYSWDVKQYGEVIASEEEKYDTRVDAQLAAEKGFRQFAVRLMEITAPLDVK